MALVDPNNLRSRILPTEPEPVAPEPVAPESPLRRPGTGSESIRALRQGMRNIKASGYALRGLVRAPFDEEGSRRDIQRSADIQARAAAEGPKIQAIKDVSGVGSALAYARNLGLSQLPNVAAVVGTAILTGGAGALAAGGARAAATSAASNVARQGLTRGATGVATGAAPTAFATGAKVGALAAGTTMQAGSIAPRVVLDPEAKGSYGARAGAAAVGSLATGAMELVPVMRLFGRYGMKKVGSELAQAATKGELAKRVAAAAAAQGRTEAGTELAQSVGERLTHKFVNENVGLLSPDAFEEYANAAVAGFVVGGAFGAPAGLRGGLRPGSNPTPSAPKAKRLPPGTRMDPAPDKDTLEGELAREMQKPVAGTIKLFSAPEVAANAKARVVNGADQWTAALSAMTTPAGEPVNETIAAAIPVVRKLLAGETLAEAEAPLAQAFYDSIQNNAIKHEFRRTVARMRQVREGVVDTPNDQLSPSMRSLAPIADESVVAEMESPEAGRTVQSMRGSTRVDPLTNEIIPSTVADVRKQMGEEPILSPDFVRNNVYNFSDGNPERIPKTARNSAIAANIKGSDGKTKRVAVNLRAVVDKMLGSELARTDMDTSPYTYERATLAALSELVSNGYDINPLSLAPGITISSRDGKVVKLSPALAARVREQFMAVRYEGDAGPAPTPNEKIDAQHRADVSKRADARRNAAIKDFEVANNELGDRRTEYSDTTTAGDVADTAGIEGEGPNRRIDSLAPDPEPKTSGKVNDQFDRYDIPTITAKARELRAEYLKPGVPPARKVKIRKQLNKYATRLGQLQRESSIVPPNERAPTAGNFKGGMTQLVRADAAAGQPVTPKGIIPKAADKPETKPLDSSVLRNTDAKTNAAARKNARAPISKTRGPDWMGVAPAMQSMLPAEKREALDKVMSAKRAAADKPLKLKPKVAATTEPANPIARGVQRAKGQLAAVEVEAAANKAAAERRRQRKAIADSIRQQRAAARKAAEKAADADKIEGDKTAPKPPNLAPLQSIVDAITKLLNVDPVKLVFDPGADNQYHPATKTIKINGRRRGGALIQTIYHEIGHHVARTKFKSASVETKKAIIADYKAWRKSQRGQKDSNAIRASRAPHMIAKLARQMVGGANTPKGRVYALKAHEYLADQIARALVADKKTGQTLTEKFFGALARALKAAYNSFSPKYLPAPSVQQWVNQLMAAQLTSTAQTPSPSVSPTQHASSLVSMLDADTRGLMEKELKRRTVINQMRAAGLDIDTYGTQLGNLIEAAAALYKTGKLKLGDDTRPILEFFERYAWRVLGFTSSAQYTKHALEAINNGALTSAGYSVRRDYAKTDYQKATLRALRFVQGPLTKHANAFFVDIGNRVRRLNIPAARELVAQFNLRPNEAGDQDMRKARVAKGGEYANRLSDIVRGWDEIEVEALQKALTTHTPPTDPKQLEAYNAIKKLLDDMYDYLVKSGVKVAKRADFYPVRVMFDAVTKDALEFKKLMGEIAGSSTEVTTELRRKLKLPEDATTDDIANVLFQHAVYNPEGGAHEYTLQDRTRPYFESARGQLSSFVFKYGTQAQKDRFAKFVDPSLDRTMGTYIRQAVRRAEFTKRFGPDGDKLTALFDKAKAQGATDTDLTLMRDYVNVALGTHERRLNPFIHRVLKLGDAITGLDWANTSPEKIHGYMAVVGAYNNIRLLGLAALSSFIDPIGVYSRTGTFGDTFRGYVKALRAMTKDDPDGLAHAAYAMGVIDRDTMNEAIAHMYGAAGEIGSWAHKVNSTLFKWNGLDHITRFTRIAALSAGHLFLMRHANPETSNKHSERFLRELGLTAADVVVDQNNTDRVVVTPKIQAALLRFVEESALRPAGEVKPSWHSDPNFQLVSQYRGYLYAFYNTVVVRMINEAKQLNFAPFAVPALAYIGVSAFAEAMRELIQYGPEGNPRREKWGLPEYAAKGFDRSGLLSPRASTLAGIKSDTDMGSSPLNSLVGPTGQHVANIVDTLQGERRLNTTFVDSLPLSSVYEDWF